LLDGFANATGTGGVGILCRCLTVRQGFDLLGVDGYLQAF